jgi:hypothetical protein
MELLRKVRQAHKGLDRYPHLHTTTGGHMNRIEEDDDIQDYKKPWVGLTDEEIEGLWKSRVSWTNNNFARAVEHLLKGKNA